ncbi:MAG TPA: DUF2130 domain-containing protein [Saprospiraceae bacterium]|nr:DUF2130 domain-containing protein [Saprospiraceae bacterium]
MHTPVQQIICPHCGEVIKIEEALAHQLNEQVKLEIKQHRLKLEAAHAQRAKELEQQEEAFEAKKKQLNDLFRERLEKEKVVIRDQMKQEVHLLYESQVKSQTEELQALMHQVHQLRGKEIELEQMKRRMELQRKEIELEYEKQMHERQRDLEVALSKRISEEMELKIREKDKQLEDQRRLIQEMQRKADQGSMQLQGEVQETAIEEWLRLQFPLDEIVEIKKGARGADCLQIVHTRQQKNAGTIYYESKRTKEFQGGWLEKFKSDMIQSNADVGILVTQTLPRDMERLGERSGVWICTFDEFKSLSYILRQTLIKINEVADHQKNKGDKMVMLYDYLTSNEFKMKMESIVDGFTQMHEDLQKEKNAMLRLWKQREKQIQKVLINTTEMYGDIKGIAGQSIPNVRQLELPIHDQDVFSLEEDENED